MGSIYRFADDFFDYHHSIDKKPCPDDFFMHAHERCEILYFLSGNGHYMVEGSEYVIEQGGFMLMRPSETHKLQIRPDSPYERIAIHFSPEVVGEIDPQGELLQAFEDRPLGQKNFYQRSSLNSGFIHECFNAMESDSTDDYFRNLAIKTYLYPILAEIRVAFLARKNEIFASTFQNISQELIKYINYNLTSSDLSLDTLSERFLISKSHLNRVFKQATGSTVWDYILIKRIMAARQMLRQGLAANEASLACGFRDYSAFYRFYKKRFHVSPLEDRR